MTLTQLATKLKGGAGSGDHGHRGRFGKRGGSAGGGKGINPGIDATLANVGYDNFSKASDKAGFIKDSMQNIANDLGFDVNVKVLSDAKFNASISADAREMGVSPTKVKGFYRAGSGEAGFRQSSIDAIKTSNDYRLFQNNMYHELGHGYQHNVMRKTSARITSQAAYNSSKNEEFADIFSSRLSGAANRAQGKRVFGALKKGQPTVDYIKDTEDQY